LCVGNFSQRYNQKLQISKKIRTIFWLQAIV